MMVSTFFYHINPITTFPCAPFSDTLALKHEFPNTGLDLSFVGSQGEYHCMWRCPRPGLNPSGLVNNSSLAAGPQFTEMKIL